MQDECKQYDVFVFPLYEDKDDFINELLLHLREDGLNIWLSCDHPHAARITLILREALELCAHALVIINNGRCAAMTSLGAQPIGEHKSSVILLLHNLSAAEIKKLYPSLASHEIITSTRGVKYAAGKILQLIAEREAAGIRGKRRSKKNGAGQGLIMLGSVIDQGDTIG